jgi:hypothetical protein
MIRVLPNRRKCRSYPAEKRYKKADTSHPKTLLKGGKVPKGAPFLKKKLKIPGHI